MDVLHRTEAATGAAFVDAAQVQWAEFRPFAALICLPAMIVVLAVGLWLDYPLSALAVASGALSAGYGFFQRVTNRHATVMLSVTAGMSVSAAIGTVANVHLWVEAPLVALWGFALGVATIVSQPLSWIALQCSIALIVAASIPAGALNALYRAGLVAAGGGLQTLVVLALAWVCASRLHDVPGAAASALRVREIAASARDVLARGTAGLGFGVVVAISGGLGSVLFHLAGLPNGYWMPMTAMLVLRPAARETRSRAVARVGGTVLGAVSVTLLVALTRPSGWVVAGMIVASAWGCFAFQRVNYLILSLCVTSYVALLFAYAGLPEPQVALHRMLATTLGGGLALVVHEVGDRLRGGRRPIGADSP